MTDIEPPQPPKKLGIFWHFVPLIVILLLGALAYVLGAEAVINIETLRIHRAELMALVGDNYVLAVTIFMVGFIIVVTLSIPAAEILAIAGGFFFGIPRGFYYAVICSVLGAVFFFLIARSAKRAWMRNRVAPFFKKMEDGFNRHGPSYLLFLRFLHFIPFWLVNLGAAFLDVPLDTYLWTTVVGVIPSSFIYAEAGTGVGRIFDEGGTISVEKILNTNVRIALVALAISALLPMAIKKLVMKRKPKK